MKRALLFSMCLTWSLGACLDAPEYYYGENLTDVRFVLWTLDTGVHPSKAVLEDPDNPFRDHPPSETMKWELLENGGDSAAFYAWATLLAKTPTGELQYYTAVLLERLHRNGALTPVELPYVKELALDAYAAVLRYFPDDVTYDATGRIPYRLAPLAYDAILALGGTPPPGWVEVATADGGKTVVFVGSETEEAP
jgi:hypothetical protein